MKGQAQDQQGTDCVVVWFLFAGEDWGESSTHHISLCWSWEKGSEDQPRLTHKATVEETVSGEGGSRAMSPGIRDFLCFSEVSSFCLESTLAQRCF